MEGGMHNATVLASASVCAVRALTSSVTRNRVARQTVLYAMGIAFVRILTMVWASRERELAPGPREVGSAPSTDPRRWT